MAASSRPEPTFRIGQTVRVIVNDRNRTPHTGEIRNIIWHHKLECYHFYLKEHGKKVSKRYAAEDLEPTEPGIASAPTDERNLR